MNYHQSNKNTLFDSIYDFIKSCVIILPLVFLIRTIGFGLYVVPSESMEPTMLIGERFLADKFTPLFRPFSRGEILSFNDPNYAYSDNYVMRLWQEYVWGPQNVTKRIIGLPGDTVKGVVENGSPTIYLKKKGDDTFEKLNEPYINNYPIIAYCDSLNAARKGFDYRSYDPSAPLDKQPFYTLSRQGIAYGAHQAQRLGRPALIQPHTPMNPNPEGPQPDNFVVELGDNQYWVMGDNRLGSGDSRCWGPLDGRLIHGRIIVRLWSIDSDNAAGWMILNFLKNPIKFFKQSRLNRCFQLL